MYHTDCLTIRQAAAELAVSRSTVYNLIRQGHIKTVRVAGDMRVRRYDLERYLNTSGPRARGSG